MSFVKEKWDKLVAGLVIALCAFWIATGGSDQSADKQKAELANSMRIIKDALRDNQVPEAYPWSKAKQVTYSDNLTKHVKRVDDPLSGAPQTYAFYPRPQKPVFEAKITPKGYEEESAVFSKPTDLSATASHENIQVTAKSGKDVPPGTKSVRNGFKYFKPVRIEFFRGTEPDKIDMNKVVGTIEIDSEEDEVPKPVVKDEVIKKPDEPVESSTDTARTARTRPQPAPATGDKPKVVVAAKEYLDFEIEPKTTYYYKARIVAKMIKLNEQGMFEVKDAGGGFKKYKPIIPAGLTPIKPAKEGSTAKLFASDLTDAVSATTPANYDFRFAGVLGELPDPKKARPPGWKPEYKANFAVRVYVTETRTWKEKYLQVGVDELLEGVVDLGNKKNFKFDSGYELVEIKDGFLVVKNEVIERDPNGKETGKKEVETRTPTQVAFLRDKKRNKVEEFPRVLKFGEQVRGKIVYE